MPGSHLDVGFTAPPSEVRRKRVATLDAVLEAAEKDPDLRWTEEGAWSVAAWLEAHAGDAPRIARLALLVREGRVSVGASWVNPHAALFPRSLDVLFAFAPECERVLGARPRVAIVNDVVSVPEAFVDAAARAGVVAILFGPNDLTSAPPTPAMSRRPFVWTTAAGARVACYVDPDGYGAAFSRWGVDPATARFFHGDRFGDREGLDLTRFAVAEARRTRPGLSIAQQAFDNWGPEAAIRTPDVARAWARAGGSPPLVTASAADVPRAWRGAALPELSGEWGGEWEEVRAGAPWTTARLRAAAEATPASAPLARRLALATAMDHTGAVGPPWAGLLTEEEHRRHQDEWAAMLTEAIGSEKAPDLDAAADRVARDAAAPPEGAALPPRLAVLLAPTASLATLRRGPIRMGDAYFGADATALAARCGLRADGPDRVVLWARLDREAIPGDDAALVDVGWEVLLRAARRDVRAWPEGSAAAARGAWLRGAPPPTFVAPDGLRISTPTGGLLLRSPVAFAYRVGEREGAAVVQVLLVRQTRACEWKGGGKAVLPFARAYPLEPSVLPAELVVERRDP